MKRLMVVMAVAAFVASKALAIDDTPENRAREADRYLAAKPMKEMIMNMVVQMAAKMPPERRRAFTNVVAQNIDYPALERTIKGIYVKHLTADELKAAADFFSSPAGQAYNRKFGAMAAEFLPAVRAELAKAQSRAETKPAKKQTQSK